MVDTKLMVTLWPSFPHFADFVEDDRLSGIRLNSAMISSGELDTALESIRSLSPGHVPLYFDVKGRQLRITDVQFDQKNVYLTLNHPIQVETPTVVLFKAGGDRGLLERVEEDGHRLVFEMGPEFIGPNLTVKPGESIHIRHPSLRVGGSLFTAVEQEKIAKVKGAGFTRYYLSYVESQRDVDEFRELVGRDAEIYLKIESKKGLEYVTNGFRKRPELTLVAARGDLYVEIDRPHEITDAMRLIIQKDPEACVGSRILLSVIHEAVPSCADFHELAWLTDIGYHKMLLCDSLCLKGDLLSTAVNVFDAFRQHYTPTRPVEARRSLLQRVLSFH